MPPPSTSHPQHPELGMRPFLRPWPMPLLRLLARELPGFGPVDLEFSNAVALLGETRCASNLLGLLHGAMVGEIPPSSLVQTSGNTRALFVGRCLDPQASQHLHDYWARRIQNPQGRRLRSAWDELWGGSSGLGPLGSSGGRNPQLVVGRPRRGTPADVEAHLLINQGSGSTAAFSLLSQLALAQHPGTVFLDGPDQSLHPLIARRILPALRVLVPSAQVIAAVRTSHACDLRSWQVFQT